MYQYTQQKEEEISALESRLERLKQDFEPYKAQEDINLLLAILPTLGENLRMAQLCKGVGLTVEAIKKFLEAKHSPLRANSIRPNIIGHSACRMPSCKS